MCHENLALSSLPLFSNSCAELASEYDIGSLPSVDVIVYAESCLSVNICEHDFLDNLFECRGRRGRDRIRFTTTYVISVYHH